MCLGTKLVEISRKSRFTFEIVWFEVDQGTSTAVAEKRRLAGAQLLSDMKLFSFMAIA